MPKDPETAIMKHFKCYVKKRRKKIYKTYYSQRMVDR